MPTNNNFDMRGFSKNVIIYVTGQIILLALGLVQAFIIPRYLSIESYGYWQMFLLYAGFTGILHLGFINGVHIKWAGKKIVDIKDEIKKAFVFLIFEEINLVVPIMIASYFLLKPPLQQICLCVLAYAITCNFVTFFIWTCYAIKKFLLLTIANIAQGILFFIFIIFLYLFNRFDYQYLMFVTIIQYLMTLSFFLFLFHKYFHINIFTLNHGRKTKLNRPDLKSKLLSTLTYGKENINVGMFVLLGNFVYVLLFSIDQLMVNSMLSLKQFAIYSFALAVIGIAYTIIIAISQVFFPYLANETNELRNKAYKLGGVAIILIWAVSLCIFLPIITLVEHYLPAYDSSISAIKILVCTIGFGSLIQILHANYFKIYGMQRKYFLLGGLSLLVSIILNLVAIKVWGTLESVAIAVLFSFVIWYIINESSLKKIVAENTADIGRSLGGICGYLLSFLLVAFVIKTLIIQIVIYLILFCLISACFFWSDIGRLAKSIRTIRVKQ
jgi:O-antigen/teichoic acid export membrane protein